MTGFVALGQSGPSGRARLFALILCLCLLSLCLLPGAAGAAGDGHGGGDKAAAAPIEPLPVRPRGLPVELVRTLQLLQDRIAHGSTQAHLAQRQLLAHIEQRLLALEPAGWAEIENVRAAVTFGLSGGGPAVLKRLIEAGTVPEAEHGLVRGALAYLQGREKEAITHLGAIDAQTMGPGLAGQLALTQSALMVREAPMKAIALLDQARLLSPGTLVEEGALRREIFVLAQAGDAKRFEALSIRYLRRFRRSVYAGNFRQRFAGALTRLDFDSDRSLTQRLERMLDEIEPEGRRDLYLLVARAGLEQGRRETALFAAERAAGLVDPESHYALQARLYRGAALIVAEGGFEAGFEALRAIDRASLASDDATLLDAALTTATQIRTPPKSGPVLEPSASASKRVVPQPQSISRAQEALARVDRMISRSEP